MFITRMTKVVKLTTLIAFIYHYYKVYFCLSLSSLVILELKKSLLYSAGLWESLLALLDEYNHSISTDCWIYQVLVTSWRVCPSRVLGISSCYNNASRTIKITGWIEKFFLTVNLITRMKTVFLIVLNYQYIIFLTC